MLLNDQNLQLFTDQGSNASKSVRFQLDRQSSLEIKFCPSEVEEEEGEDDLEDIEEEEDEESDATGHYAMNKPVGPLGKSPLSPLSPIGRPSSPMLNPATTLGSPSRKPPARLNPLAPLGKIEKKPADGEAAGSSGARGGGIVKKPLPPRNVLGTTGSSSPSPVLMSGSPERPESARMPHSPARSGTVEDDEEKVRVFFHGLRSRS